MKNSCGQARSVAASSGGQRRSSEGGGCSWSGYVKTIRYTTRGVADLIRNDGVLHENVLAAFYYQSNQADDWFSVLEVDGQRFFVAENGEDGYTVMLPEGP